MLCAPCPPTTQACPVSYLACDQSTPITVGIQPCSPVTIVQVPLHLRLGRAYRMCEHEATEGYTDDDHRNDDRQYEWTDALARGLRERSRTTERCRAGGGPTSIPGQPPDTARIQAPAQLSAAEGTAQLRASADRGRAHRPCHLRTVGSRPRQVIVSSIHCALLTTSRASRHGKAARHFLGKRLP